MKELNHDILYFERGDNRDVAVKKVVKRYNQVQTIKTPNNPKLCSVFLVIQK